MTSKNFKSTLAKVSAEESPLVLLEISHEDLTVPIRVVNDNDDITCNGELFIACAFRFIPPDNYEGQLPKAKLAIDNIGRELTEWIEKTNGGRGAVVKAMSVMRSRPNVIENSIKIGLSSVLVTTPEVSGELGYANYYGQPAILMQYRPDTTPGIF